MNTEIREAFEIWAKGEAKKTSRGFNELTLERDYSAPDYYATLWVNAAWRGWQASRQALEGEPTAVINKSAVGDYEFFPTPRAVDMPNGIHKLYAHPASSQALEGEPVEVELIADTVRDHFGDIFACTRAWSAWQVGTMTRDDFTPANLTELADEIAESVAALYAHSTRCQALESEQLEVWLGSGDKLVADIYADDGSYAGVGIFNPPNGKAPGLGEKDDQIDGMSLDKNKALVLIKSTRPESLQVVVEELQEAMTKMGYTHPASADECACDDRGMCKYHGDRSERAVNFPSAIEGEPTAVINKSATGDYEFFPAPGAVDMPNGIHKLYTHPASADEPDLFWNCGDIDGSGDRGVDHVISMIADGMDLSSTDTFPIMRAQRLPDRDVFITVNAEGDVEWKWAEPKQEQDDE